MNRFSLLLLASVLSLPAIFASGPDSFEEDPYVLLCGEADSAIARGDYPEAVARIKDAISVRPYSASNVLLEANLGMVYSLMDSDSLAELTLRNAIREYPDMKTVHSRLAKVLLKQKRDREAYEEFTTVVTLDSADTEARYYRGIMALYSGDKSTAEADFEVLRSLEPKLERTALALATLYSMTGRNREAILQYEALIEVEPAPEYYSALAGCHLQLGELSEASITIASGLKLYPDDPELYYYRAWLNRDRYRSDEARADAAKAIHLGANPARVNALFNQKRASGAK